MPAYCVGQVCLDVERVPEPETIRAGQAEERQRQASGEITRALTRAHHVGEFARRPALRVGERAPS